MNLIIQQCVEIIRLTFATRTKNPCITKHKNIDCNFLIINNDCNKTFECLMNILVLKIVYHIEVKTALEFLNLIL